MQTLLELLAKPKGGKNRCKRENESGQPTTTVHNTRRRRRRRRGETTTEEMTAVDLFSPASYPHTKQRAASFTTNGCCAKDLQQGTGAVADDKRSWTAAATAALEHDQQTAAEGAVANGRKRKRKSPQLGDFAALGPLG
jgi:hypothetical protein